MATPALLTPGSAQPVDQNTAKGLSGHVAIRDPRLTDLWCLPLQALVPNWRSHFHADAVLMAGSAP